MGSQIYKKVIESNCLPLDGLVVVGVSGGPDSVCLLHSLVSISQAGVAGHFCIRAVHVEHSIRPVEGAEDSAYVKSLCEELGVHLRIEKVDVPKIALENKQTMEEAGREARYRAFAAEAACACQGNCLTGCNVKIAVAHNRGDLAETVLMRIVRGTGIDGLVGMGASRMDSNGFEIIRPLLFADRQEILDYCAENGLHPRFDSTNVDTSYLRNRVRAELIPLLKKDYNDRVVDSLLRLSAAAAEDRDYFDGIVASILERYLGAPQVRIPVSVLNELHPAIRHRLVRRVFFLLGLTQDVERSHLAAADKLFAKNLTGKRVEFRGGYSLAISYGDAVFEKSPGDRTIQLNGDSHLERGSRQVVILKELLRSGYAETGGFAFEIVPKASQGSGLTLDIDSLIEDSETLQVRTRESGDIIHPKGMTGSKKLKDFFIDRKIPREVRSELALVAACNIVLLIPGVVESRKYSVTGFTKNLLLIRELFP